MAMLAFFGMAMLGLSLWALARFGFNPVLLYLTLLSTAACLAFGRAWITARVSKGEAQDGRRP